jgi:hypothetical protein
MTKRFLFSLLSALGLTVAGFALQLSAPAASPVAPESAAACHVGGDYCEINYHNTHSKAIVVCRDWTTAYGDGVNEKGTCKYTYQGGARRTLYNGQQTGNPNSSGGATFNWDDTDGFYVNAGYGARVHTDDGSWYWHTGKGWHKQSGCGDCLADLYHYAR